MRKYNVVIIGGGSAGLAAAIKCYELGIKDILLLEKEEYLGGILNQCIHNGFGLHEFKEQLSGPEYAYRFIEQIKNTDVEIKLSSTVSQITKDKHIIYSNAQEGYVEVVTETIIFTLGCYERGAGAIQLPGDRPQGIYSAGTAQKYLNIDGYLVGKKVFILGSGDIGLIMARRMTLEGAKVLGVAEIMPYSNGLNRNIVQCLNDFNIPLYLSHTVTDVIAKDGKLSKIVISQVDQKLKPIVGSEKTFEVDTLLLSIGLCPQMDLLNGLGLQTHPRTRGPYVNEHNETMVKGVFAAGNGLHVHDLVDFVSEEAREAAVGVYNYLNNKLHYDDKVISTINGTGIGYVIPQIIHLSNIEEGVTFKFRVSQPMKNVDIYIKSEDKIIKKIYKLTVIPSEMEKIFVSKNCFDETMEKISLEIKEREI